MNQPSIAPPLAIASPALSVQPCSLLSQAESMALDQATITAGTEGLALMHRAAAAVVTAVRDRFAACRCLILCGTGKNGSDGFLIAEALRQSGWNVVCVLAGSEQAIRGDAALARQQFQGDVTSWAPALLTDAELVIDALVGIGIERPLNSALAQLVQAVNEARLPVVAVDMPSGVHPDSGAIMGCAIQAQLTVTFTRKKPGLLLLPGREYAGEVVIRSIGVDERALEALPLMHAENLPCLWQSQLPSFTATQHKYDHGHALLLGGGVMTGAARLAARAAQRSGAGLVTVAAPPYATLVYASNLDSVLVQPISTVADWEKQIGDRRKTALLLGPGAGIGELLQQQVLAALESDKPTVLDADALTSFVDAPETLFRALRPHTVLTPHSGEFLRLFGPQLEFSDKLAVVSRMARLLQCVILLKGADTVIAAPDGRALINSNAPPWLATAGSGDVLAGIIAGLLAQGVESFAASAIAAWLHGAAAQNFSPGMIAEDLIAAVPAALQAAITAE